MDIFNAFSLKHRGNYIVLRTIMLCFCGQHTQWFLKEGVSVLKIVD